MAFTTTAAPSIRLAGEARVFEFLRSHAPTDRVSVCVSTSGRRGLRPTADLMRDQAAAVKAGDVRIAAIAVVETQCEQCLQQRFRAFRAWRGRNSRRGYCGTLNGCRCGRTN